MLVELFSLSLTQACKLVPLLFFNKNFLVRKDNGPVCWLVLVLVWAGWCWFFVRGKYCWLAGLGWLKPTSEQAVQFETTAINTSFTKLFS